MLGLRVLFKIKTDALFTKSQNHSIVYNSMIDSLWAISIESHLSGMQNTIDSLQSELTTLQTKTVFLTEIIQTSNDSIANQLSAANNLLAFIAIALTIVGAIIGFYIRRKKLEVEGMVKLVDEKKQTVDDIAQTTKELDDKINSNLKELYQKMRKEETNALLDRLVLEPRDISNLVGLLLARDLDEDGFAKVREAYLKLDAEPEEDPDAGIGFFRISASSSDEYNLLFFQHYCNQAVKDDLIRPDFVKGFAENCKKAFKRDIIKSTIDLCRALSDETSVFNKEEVLTTYLKALNGCKHKNLEELRNILEQNITPQSLLEKAKEQCTRDGVYLSLFGITKPDGEGNHEETTKNM